MKGSKYAQIAMVTGITLLLTACGSNESSESVATEVSTEESSTEETNYETDTEEEETSTTSKHVGDSFTLNMYSNIDNSLLGTLQYDVTDVGVTRIDEYKNYVYVSVDITNISDNEMDFIETPQFYADGYSITDQNPDTFDDETVSAPTLNPGKKLAAKYYQIIDNPFIYSTVEADFGDVEVMIIDDQSIYTDSQGNVIYEQGSLVGDPYEISGTFYDEASNSLLSVEMTDPFIYTAKITAAAGTVEGEGQCEFEEQAGSYVPVITIEPTSNSNIGKIKFSYYRNQGWYSAFIYPAGSTDFEAFDYYQCDEDTYDSKMEELTSSQGESDTSDNEETQAAETDSDEDDYIIPNSDSEYIDASYVDGWSVDEINMAINEIYARHGREFNTQEIQDYFDAQSWYTPLYSPEDFDAISDSLLNDYEKANIKTLAAARDAASESSSSTSYVYSDDELGQMAEGYYYAVTGEYINYYEVEHDGDDVRVYIHGDNDVVVAEYLINPDTGMGYEADNLKAGIDFTQYY